MICLAVSNLAKLFEDQFDEFLPADKIYKAMADALLPKATEATSQSQSDLYHLDH